MKCATCNGKGYVPDGRKSANSGLPCPDCLDPAVCLFALFAGPGWGLIGLAGWYAYAIGGKR